MILVVSAGALDLAVAGNRERERVDSASAAATALSEGRADVVHYVAGGEDPVPLLQRVRDGEFDCPRLPVVLVARGLDREALPLLAFDQVVAPDRPDALEEALATAHAVADYQATLHEFYDACQSRADAGVTDPLEESTRLRELRDEADDRLSALLSDPAVFADLLWSPDDDEAGDFGFGRLGDLDAPDDG